MTQPNTIPKAMITRILLTAFAVLLSAQFSDGHMIMKSPVPYGIDTLNNSPLGPSDFPCKQRAGVYAIKQVNDITVGEQQTLSFTGSATHGGGSCQLSVSLDKEPTARSTFKVIHSIVGGCPTTGTDPATLNFTVPKEVPNGEWTLAWTWFNRIGNREMYMNCAPVSVSGGANDNTLFEKLPDMFVANIADTQCTTPEGKDIMFPNPGDAVETVVTTALATPPGQCGKAAMPSSTSIGLSIVTIPSASAPAGSSYTVSQSSNPGGISTSSSASSQMAAMTSMATTTATATSSPSAYSNHTVTATPSSSVAATASINLPAPSGTGKSTCGQEGALRCNGLSRFGLCDHGRIVWQPVAPGTRCVNGQILKRSFRFAPHGHVTRRHERFV